MSLRHILRHLFHPQRSNNHRPRVLHPHSFFALALIGVGFVGLLNGGMRNSTQLGAILGFSSSISPAQIVEQTNAERAQLGLAPLKINSKLTQAALAKGQDMMSDQYWAHIAPDGKEPWAFINEAGYTYRVAGENLARDFSTTGDMVAAWMKSPTHRANIVNDRYQEIGIAVIDGSLSGHETTLVVQMFGAPQAVTTAPQVLPASSAMGQAQAQEETTQARVVLESEELSFSQPAILASAMVPQGDFTMPPLFSALQLTKAFFLGLIMMIVVTLVYDSAVIGNYKASRLVGKNLAHIIFFISVSFLLIFFKGGIVG